jgi:hypothetical protein
MNSITRKLVSLLGIVAVVFAQLLVSAYACPMLLMGADDVSAATPQADTCADDMASPALCQKHCENAQQNINDAPQPLAGVALAPAFAVKLPAVMGMALSVPALQPSLLHATSPPHAIRHCCWRI